MGASQSNEGVLRYVNGAMDAFGSRITMGCMLALIRGPSTKDAKRGRYQWHSTSFYDKERGRRFEIGDCVIAGATV
jgi:hypothetical protein